MILCTQISAQPCTKTLISRDLNAPLPISRQAWSLPIPMTRSYPDKHAPISGFLKHAVIQSTESSKILNFRGLFHESHFRSNCVNFLSDFHAIFFYDILSYITKKYIERVTNSFNYLFWRITNFCTGERKKWIFSTRAKTSVIFISIRKKF